MTCTPWALSWARSCANRAARRCSSRSRTIASPPSARRDGEPQARAQLAARVRGRPPALTRDLVRAFSTWFQVVNLAEKVHRIRRRRDYFLKDSQRPQPGGVEDAIAQLKGQGLSAVRGRSTCSAGCPSSRCSPRTPPRPPAARCCASSSASPSACSSGWIPRSLRTRRTASGTTCAWSSPPPGRPRSSRASGSPWRMSASRSCSTCWRSSTAWCRPSTRRSPRRWRSSTAPAAGAVRVPSILHFGSWVGGDMDGNPDVHAKTIRETLARQNRVDPQQLLRRVPGPGAAALAERQPRRGLPGAAPSASSST